jgi:hypothetical protein
MEVEALSSRLGLLQEDCKSVWKSLEHLWEECLARNAILCYHHKSRRVLVEGYKIQMPSVHGCHKLHCILTTTLYRCWRVLLYCCWLEFELK